MRIALADVANEEFLKKVWKKEVRPAIRKMTFGDINLAPDPLHYAGYEWGLDALVVTLAKDLRSGRYSPERGEIVRAAKSKGLSRPLCFLATRDALVYRAITTLAHDQLVTFAQEWVGVAHSDKGSPSEEPDADSVDSFDWFRFWLARQGHIIKMVDDAEVSYFVESDIANFFPSIRLEAIREHLHSQTNLEKEVVRLCIQIIDGVMPRRDYSEVSLMGLPQEQIGASREIAHSLLAHVDKEFEAEGSSGRYTRFMDDILIGVETIREGEACISRLQQSLESLGLYPNPAKTIIASTKKYLHDAMLATNAEIDRLDYEIKQNTSGKPAVAVTPDDIIADLKDLSDKHRAMVDRPKRWDRVLRRLYTLHRIADFRDWSSVWVEDLLADPAAAPVILEYVRSWPLDENSVSGLTYASASLGDLYPNVAILCAETVASAPVRLDEDLWQYAFASSQAELARLIDQDQRTLARERLAAAWLVAAWKFADEEQRDVLLAQVPPEADALSPLRVQALPLLAAAGNSLSEWVAAKPGLAWENAMAAEYLRSLQEGDEKAVTVALSLLYPQIRLKPQRYIVLPRAVPLLEIASTSAPKQVKSAKSAILNDLKKNSPRLRDYRVESIVTQSGVVLE